MLSWDIALGGFLKLLCDSMGNSYCESDYSKGEVNVVKITHIRLKKKKKKKNNVARASFYYLVSKI